MSALLLAACFSTGETALFDSRDAVTPLPDQFALAALDTRGRIETGASKTVADMPALLKISRVNGAYRIDVQGAGDGPGDVKEFRLYPLEGGWHAAELRTGAADKPGYFYTILRLGGDTLEIAAPSRIGVLADALTAAGIAHDPGLACCSFDDPAALRRALVLATGQTGTLEFARYRVATDAATISRLDKLAASLAEQERTAEAAEDAPAGTGPAGLPAIGPIGAIADKVLASSWARRDGDYRVMRVEFYNAAVFQFSVKTDRSVCTFLIAFNDREDGDVNKGLDRGCDGYIERIALIGAEAETRAPTPDEHAQAAPVLAAFPALFDAVDGFATYVPKAQLALLPDPAVINRNFELLQGIATAATGSELRARRDPGDNTAGEVIWQIWVNGGRDDGGYEVFFAAKSRANNTLHDCYWGSDGPGGKWGMFDDDCDATPEASSENGFTRSLSIAGNEKAVQGMLLDVARFAQVANEAF